MEVIVPEPGKAISMPDLIILVVGFNVNKAEATGVMVPIATWPPLNKPLPVTRKPAA